MVKHKGRKSSRQSASTPGTDTSAASTSRTNRNLSSSGSLHSTPQRLSAPSTSRANVSTHPNTSSRNKKRRVEKRVVVNEGGGLFKVSQKIIREIRRLQKSVIMCIPRLPFSRLIREIIQSHSGCQNFRIQLSALQALQESSEYFLVAYLEDAHRAALHARRITIMPRDIELVRYFRNRI